ncbi:hypothetical protein, partial [Salinispira pacifica]
MAAAPAALLMGALIFCAVPAFAEPAAALYEPTEDPAVGSDSTDEEEVDADAAGISVLSFRAVSEVTCG